METRRLLRYSGRYGTANSFRTASRWDLIRDWRARRRMSQLDLALEAGVSQRHLSFVESGRAAPSRDMVEMLCEHLDLPLRERNVVLLSAGFAPAFAERKLSDPSMAVARGAVERVLKGHEPNPAFAVDRWWNLQMANAAVAPMLALVEEQVHCWRGSPTCCACHCIPAVCRRASLIWASGSSTCCGGSASRWMRRATQSSPRWKKSSPAIPHAHAPRRERTEADAIALTFELKAGDKVLSFITTTTIFGTPADVTLSELAVEAFFPANAETAATMQALMATG